MFVAGSTEFFIALNPAWPRTGHTWPLVGHFVSCCGGGVLADWPLFPAFIFISYVGSSDWVAIVVDTASV